MANRRMFALTIIDSDAFLEMPASTQGLYFHLAMRADDDGFVNNPKRIMRMIGASEDDLKILFAKRFLIGFETGVVVIKHWKIHNYIQSDRYTKTHYLEELSKLEVKSNKAYTERNKNVEIPMMETECIQDGYMMDTQVRLGKDRLDKDSIKNTCPNSDELDASLKEETELAKKLSDIILEFDPNAKVPTTFKKWAKTIDRTMRIDKRTSEQIIWLFRWAQNNEFWNRNIRSPEALRKHWDRLVAEAKAEQNKKAAKQKPLISDETLSAIEKYERMKREQRVK